MRTSVVSWAAAGLLLLGLAGCGGDGEAVRPTTAVPVIPTAPPPSGSGAAAIVAAANAFLGALTGDERNDVLFDRGDKGQQQRWSNLPQGMYERAGLMVGDLEQSKVTAFLTLMRTTLSTEGFDRLAQLKAGLPETSFAWYGPTAPGSAAYFRITGPHLVVEYSPQAMGGDAVNHIHGIYRDPTDDYGGTVCS